MVVALGLTALGWDNASGAQAAQAAAEIPVPADEVEGIIFERQQVMLQLEKDSDMLGRIIAGEVPPDKLAETARAIAQGAKDAKLSFDAKVPGGRSKPEVWSNWADYSQRMDSFVSNAEAMAKVAETGNVTGVIEVMSEAMPCKQCHDVYRAPKKPAA